VTRSPDPDYRILRPLATGGMAVVLLAEHRHTSERAVIKLIRDELAGDWEVTQRFDREARIMARLEHPNIVRLRTWGPLREGGRFLVLDFIEGRTLHDHIDERGPLQVDRLHRVASDVLAALQASHDAGVVHRDLKPENVLLTRPSTKDMFDRAVLIDFGISRRRNVTVMEEPNITAANTIMGTPDFMSPEQAASEEVDHRSDLYSFGCMLHFMATGRAPFEHHSALMVLNMHIHDSPDLTGLRHKATPELVALVADLLAKKPDERPQDAAEIQVRLNAAHTAKRHAQAGKRKQLLARVGKELGAASPGREKDGVLGKLKGLLKKH